MSAPDNGGSAFPEIVTDWRGDHGEYQHDTYSAGGMTLRDYFAAKAMAVLIEVEDLDNSQDRDDFAAECAEGAYAYADAMLKAREA